MWNKIGRQVGLSDHGSEPFTARVDGGTFRAGWSPLAHFRTKAFGKCEGLLLPI